LDSTVLIAALAEAHEHHSPSLDLLLREKRPVLAIAAHSYAEAYSTLTRHGERGPFRFSSAEAWAALESVRAITMLVGLSAAQTFDAVRTFARDGGIGGRLYDRLIGESARVHDIPIIITWNIKHMRSLFPTLAVLTPKDFLTSAAGTL